MPRKSEDVTFEEGQVIAVPVTDKDGKTELRPALITEVQEKATFVSSAGFDYAFIEADGSLGYSKHCSGYEREVRGIKHIDFASVRTVVDLPPDWRAVATEFDLREAEHVKKQRKLHNEWEPERHPSYGVVSVSRIQGSQSLFMSPFTHQHSMRLTIARAVKYRGLSNDRSGTAGEARLLEIGLSEAQWARLLSSVGNGEGVPCTLAYVGGQQMPECPAQVEVEKFHADVKRDMDDAASALLQAEELAEALLNDKAPTKAKREELLSAVRRARAELTSGLPFVAQQLRERMEHIVAEGKTEIEAFAQRTLQRVGLERLLGAKTESPVHFLTEKDDES